MNKIEVVRALNSIIEDLNHFDDAIELIDKGNGIYVIVSGDREPHVQLIVRNDTLYILDLINPDNYQSHLFTDIKDIHAQNISDDLDPEDDEWNEEAFVIRIELVDGTEIDLD